MSSRSMVLIAAVSLLLCAQLGMTAHEERLPSGTQVVFVAHILTTFSVGVDATLVLTGPPQGPVAIPGNCGYGISSGFPGNFGQLQSAVSASPGGNFNGPIGDVIVTHINGTIDPAPLPAGTRLGSILQLSTCGISNEYVGYLAYVE